MLLHRNESSTQKTMKFVDMDAYVNENYNLSLERVTVCKFQAVQISTLTQNSSSKEKEQELSWILQMASNLTGPQRDPIVLLILFSKQI